MRSDNLTRERLLQLFLSSVFFFIIGGIQGHYCQALLTTWLDIMSVRPAVMTRPPSLRVSLCWILEIEHSGLLDMDMFSTCLGLIEASPLLY